MQPRDINNTHVLQCAGEERDAPRKESSEKATSETEKGENTERRGGLHFVFIRRFNFNLTLITQTLIKACVRGKRFIIASFNLSRKKLLKVDKFLKNMT